jgi:hypothetical protein
VIEAVGEVPRVAFGVDEVDSALSVRGVLHVGAAPKGGRNVDHDAAGLPGLALVVRPGHGRLEAVVEAAEEVVDPAPFAGESVQVRVRDARGGARHERALFAPGASPERSDTRERMRLS